MNQVRLNKILKRMEDSGIPQLIICDPASIFYLTGQWIHPGERMLALYLTLSGQHKLFVNELFLGMKQPEVETVWFNDMQQGAEALAPFINEAEPVGVDKTWTANFLLRLMELKKTGSFVNGSGLVDCVRMIKDAEEQQLMREASQLNDVAIDRVIALVSQNYSEKKLAQLLPEIYGDLGAEGCSFDPIIAYGAHGATSHHEPEECLLKPGDSVIIDIGCRKNSYCSDMTRTVFYKFVSDEAKKIYNIVLEANRRAIEKVKPGARFCDIDAAARDYIAAAGYGQFFNHRTGHSIGLDVHDYGDVSSANTNAVEPGMIFSIEPSLKLPGECGVRIEDLVLVTQSGVEVLNAYDKELLIVE
ncbi:MAG: peptidase family protein [Firmicutes bacterium]|nr:peptidase family protein [Bacillota bacterium]